LSTLKYTSPNLVVIATLTTPNGTYFTVTSPEWTVPAILAGQSASATAVLNLSAPPQFAGAASSIGEVSLPFDHPLLCSRWVVDQSNWYPDSSSVSWININAVTVDRNYSSANAYALITSTIYSASSASSRRTAAGPAVLA
jgi:hypothetical protein